MGPKGKRKNQDTSLNPSDNKKACDSASARNSNSSQTNNSTASTSHPSTSKTPPHKEPLKFKASELTNESSSEALEKVDEDFNSISKIAENIKKAFSDIQNKDNKPNSLLEKKIKIQTDGYTKIKNEKIAIGFCGGIYSNKVKI